MRSPIRHVLATAIAGVALSVPVWPAAAHAAGGVPYKDPSASGVLTLCDATGKAVTSGSTSTAPFLAAATSSFTPPPAYAGAGSSATLFGFQPRQGVDPAQWSGQKLTGTTRYSGAQPTAVFTAQDAALSDFTDAFPPTDDGLVQLRLILSAPDEPPYGASYPTVDLRISSDGSTWTALETGTAPCAAGEGTSSETQAQGGSAGPTAGASPAPGRSSAASGSAGHSPSPFVTAGTARNVFGLVPGPSGTPVPVGDDDPPSADPPGSTAMPGATGGATGGATAGGPATGAVDVPGTPGLPVSSATASAGTAPGADAGESPSAAGMSPSAGAAAAADVRPRPGGVSVAVVVLIVLLAFALGGGVAAVVLRGRRKGSQATGT